MLSYTTHHDPVGKSRFTGKSLFFLLLFFFPFISIYSQDTLNVPADYSTIQAAIDASFDGDLVLVADGTYLENINFSGKAITVASHFLVDGDSTHRENTIIDGSQPIDSSQASVVRFASGEDTTSVLNGFTIKNGFGTIWFGNFRVGGGIYIDNASPIIRNNIIELNELISDNKWVWGSAIFVIVATHKTVIIESNILRNNLAQTTGASSYAGGTIYVYAEHTTVGGVTIYNNIISDNVIQGGGQGPRGGAIAVMGSDKPDFSLYIENNKIFRNEVSANGSAAGGGMWLLDVQAEVKNNIIAYNSAKWGGAIAFGSLVTSQQCTTVVSNNTIYGNSGTVSAISTVKYYEIINCIIWGNSSPLFDPSHAAYITYSDIEDSTYSNGSHNITEEPMFVDTLIGDFHLQDSSPCIGMGIDSLEINGVWRYCPPFDIEGNPRPNPSDSMPDMGAYESEYPVGIEENFSSLVPDAYSLEQNYPNPFNPSTKIRFSIPEVGITTLKVYDILGSEVATLVNEEKVVGTYELTWYAEDLPSGVYFYQLKAGEYINTKKMLLLK